MNEEFETVRCPRCGGINLQAAYYKNADKTKRISFWGFGIIGIIIGLLKGKRDNGKRWICLQCGHEFPME